MSKYWEQRATQRELESILIAERYLASMDLALKEAQQDILRQIDAFYGRYANDNKMTLAEARKTLTANELKAFKEVDLKGFREMALSGNPMYEPLLNAISYRVRISRLEALNANIQMTMLQLYGSENGLHAYTYTGLSEVYKNTYYHTMFDLAAFGAAGTVQYLSDTTMREILSYNWSDKEFSTRIWGHQKQTIDDVRKALERSFAAGHSLDRTSKAIMERTGVARSRVEALVRTESNFFHNLAAHNSYVDSDLEKYEILATLDMRTSDICRGKDGKIYPTKDYQPGKTAPPFHVRCRTTTIPWFDESEYMENEQRQSMNGLVDSHNYEEWYNKTVTIPKQKAEQIESQRRQNVINQTRNDIKSGVYQLQHNRNRFDNHNPSHKNYESYVERNRAKGKLKPSYLTISFDQANDLVMKYAGTGKLKLTKKGEWDKKEIISHDSQIGVHINQSTGKETPTKSFNIHYGKTGTHIVPTLVDEE